MQYHTIEVTFNAADLPEPNAEFNVLASSTEKLLAKSATGFESASPNECVGGNQIEWHTLADGIHF
jgi:hypothetical protein